MKTLYYLLFFVPTTAHAYSSSSSSSSENRFSLEKELKESLSKNQVHKHTSKKVDQTKYNEAWEDDIHKRNVIRPDEERIERIKKEIRTKYGLTAYETTKKNGWCRCQAIFNWNLFIVCSGMVIGFACTKWWTS